MGVNLRRATRTIGAVLAIGWAAIACFTAIGPTAQAGTATATAVMMSNYAFAPSSITVHVGDSISWTNHDQAPHNIVTTSAPVTINSPTLSDGQSWSYTFTTPGTYDYICGVHPDMHATVVVLAVAPVRTTKAAPSTSPPASHRPQLASMPSGPPMTGPHPATSSNQRASSQPAASATPAVAAVTSPAVSGAAVAAVTQPSGVSSARLKPLLLVAGVIAAVTVFCLLALASRPHGPTD